MNPEQEFQNWLRLKGISPGVQPDYDYRAYWKSMKQGNAQQGDNQHYPDTFKTPYHRTFSNESQYALPGASQWIGNQLQMQPTGAVLADETEDVTKDAANKFLQSIIKGGVQVLGSKKRKKNASR